MPTSVTLNPATISKIAPNSIVGNNNPTATAVPMVLSIAEAKALLLLGNVENTSDASKPISSAARVALDALAARIAAVEAKAGGGSTAPAAGSVALKTSTTYVPALGDDYLELSNTAGVTFTIPTNASVAFPIGTVLTLEQAQGAVKILAATGVILQVASTHKAITNGKYAVVRIKKKSLNTWILFGNLILA